MTRVLGAAAALTAAVVLFVAWALPPASAVLPGGAADDSLAGAFHVHTNRSDGRSSPDDVAAAAARAGLRFVVFTDHGDATRRPDPPTYRSGVLCLDAVEISTDDGHLIAMGLPEAPYPLAGEARDVLEDVHRMGGIGVAAHPDSPRQSLQWRDWRAPIDGVELLNLDTAWRVHVAQGGWRAARQAITALSTYLVRPEETIAGMIRDRPDLPARLSEVARGRRVSVFAGVDAHARLALRDGEPGDNRWTLALPGYETVFRTLAMRVRPVEPWSGDAGHDAAQLLAALRDGRSYAVLDAVLSPPAFQFSATGGRTTIADGGDGVADGPTSLVVRTNAPPTFTTTVWRDDTVLVRQPASPELTLDAPPGPGVFRAEVRATDRPFGPPWILSNTIVLRAPTAQATAPARAGADRPAAARRVLFDDRTAGGWATEAAPDSRVAFDIARALDRRELRVRFGLPGGAVYGQYAALVVSLGEALDSSSRTLRFTVRGERPMRLSVQLRAPTGGDGLRWRRSTFVDAAPRTIELPFDDFRAVGDAPGPVALDTIRAILFVVDQVNTSPGASGRFWLSDVDVR